MDQQQQQAPCVPPGFRFHPTEEELVGYYLARKVASQKIDLDIIREVDLYRIEPWDLQERCGYYGGAGAGAQEEPSEYYFFSYKDRKYPSGTRTNRATAAGFWKATGRDKPVIMSRGGGGGGRVIGMRKTLVFYKGRAPNGRKTDWIMHEYRLQSNHDSQAPLPPPPQEEGWVVCRAFQKPIPNHHHHHLSPTPIPAAAAAAAAGYYDHFLGSTSSLLYPRMYNTSADDEELFLFESKNNKHLLLSIPQLIESPNPTPTPTPTDWRSAAAADLQIQGGGGGLQQAAGTIDWNFLDTLLSSSMTLPPPEQSAAP